MRGQPGCRPEGARGRSRGARGRLAHQLIYAVAGFAIFGAFAIFDFNRLRRASDDGAVVIAAGIFLDIFNVFLLLLNLFGGAMTSRRFAR